MQPYELVVIGSGPGGQRAAIQAAKAGKRVAIVEKQNGVGGVCINTGTIPSKTMREAVAISKRMEELTVSAITGQLSGISYQFSAMSQIQLMLMTDTQSRTGN